MWICVTLEDCSGSVSSRLFTSEVKMSVWGNQMRLAVHAGALAQACSPRCWTKNSSGVFACSGKSATCSRGGARPGWPRLWWKSVVVVVVVLHPLTWSLLECIKWKSKWRLTRARGWVFNGTLCHRLAFVASVHFGFHTATPAHICLHLLFGASRLILADPSVLCRPRWLVSPERWNNLQKSRTPAGRTAGLFSVLPAQLSLFHSLPL